MCFSAAPSQARSCASVAVAASTSDATPVAWAARSRSRVGHGVGRRGEARGLRRAIGLVDLGRGVDVLERREAAGPDHGAVLNPGDDRDALQNGACRRCGGATSAGSDVGGDEAVM